ncbi:MAG: recombination regulator RecX [Gammaproteobacteria bacterium]|nr:recombination regulator RecX [Gammaproteobacteria bacterium]
MNRSDSKVEIRKKAMDLLARREHSAQELRQKLTAREFDNDAIEEAMRGLRDDGLQSDERFAESYINSRFNAGIGPRKIRFELRQRGIADELVDRYLDLYSERWDQSMIQQRVRKYGDAIPEDHAGRMKQARFLQNRGFSPESVMRLFR